VQISSEEQTHIERLYMAFNARDIDAVLSGLAPDVEWPNGWEGGYVRGHDDVRSYWTRQWAELDPTVTPTGFADEADGRLAVTVRQVVSDRRGTLLADRSVVHIYRFAAGEVVHMEIRDQ
jgi:ketosteroid isomerase-like protein